MEQPNRKVRRSARLLARQQISDVSVIVRNATGIFGHTPEENVNDQEIGPNVIIIKTEGVFSDIKVKTDTTSASTMEPSDVCGNMGIEVDVQLQEVKVEPLDDIVVQEGFPVDRVHSREGRSLPSLQPRSFILKEISSTQRHRKDDHSSSTVDEISNELYQNFKSESAMGESLVTNENQGATVAMVKRSAQKLASGTVPPESKEKVDVLDIGLDSQTKNPRDLVFDSDFLRETIIGHVIHDNGGKFSAKDALSCRLIQKSWLDSVFKCLVKSGHPLTRLLLSQLSDRYVDVEAFIKIYKLSSSPFPFKLAVTFYACNFEQDLKLLENCIHLCCNGLLELELRCNLNNAFLKEKKTFLDDFTRQSFTCPVLQKIRYGVSSAAYNNDEVNDDIFINSFLLQLILSGCLHLKYFHLYIGGSLETQPTSRSFGNLLLPVTITNLVLDCRNMTNHLEPLMQNNMFPKLTNLTVVVPDIVYEDKAWMFPVLNRVRDTLKTLKIRQNWKYYSKRRTGEMTRVDPPVMKCMERIYIRTQVFEWADGVSDLPQKLPVLRKLVLKDIMLTHLKKWTENSTFGCLTDVSIQLRYPEYLTLKQGQLMPEAFSNVTTLRISTVCRGNVYRALQCLFQNMTQLQVLTIKLRQRGTVHRRYLDSLLLGIPLELVRSLNAKCKRSEYWQAVKLRLDKHFSVTNLPELRELSLDFDGSLSYPTFVSDKVKKIVVSTMPNLQKISLPLATNLKIPPSKIPKLKQHGRIFHWE